MTSQPTRTPTQADAAQHLDDLDTFQITTFVQIVRILERLSPLDRYLVETQLHLEACVREERDGPPPNDNDPTALAAWAERVRAADAATGEIKP